MICISCGSGRVQWQGPASALTHTKCPDCGDIDCHHVTHGTEEGERCGRDLCTGYLAFRKVENCSCHINPPCGACVSTPLHCPECQWEAETP